MLSLGGGDLMSDLMSKLTMRRKGISGTKTGSEGGEVSSGGGGGGAMDKISLMIPPPPGPLGGEEEGSDDGDWD